MTVKKRFVGVINYIKFHYQKLLKWKNPSSNKKSCNSIREYRNLRLSAAMVYAIRYARERKTHIDSITSFKYL